MRVAAKLIALALVVLAGLIPGCRIGPAALNYENPGDLSVSVEVEEDAPVPEKDAEAEQILETMLSRRERESAPASEPPPAVEDPPAPELPSILGSADGPPAEGEADSASLGLDVVLGEIARAAGGEKAALPSTPPPPTAPPAPEAVVTRSPPPAGGPQPADTPSTPPQKVADLPRPSGKTVFYGFFHKTAADFVDFLKDDFGDLIDKKYVSMVDGKPRTVLFFGEDAIIAELAELADNFDGLELKLERLTIRPNYVDVGVLVESLTMASLCNVWSRVEETVTTQQLQGNNKWKTTATHIHSVYAPGSLAKGQAAPVAIHERVPYVFEIPWTDPFVPPRVSTGQGVSEQQTIDFRNPASTEARGAMVAVGTASDIERIQAFVDSIDKPARQIMIEVQLIELNADKISDIGIDSVQFGQRHSIVDFAGPFPGEEIGQPGLGADVRRPGFVVSPAIGEGLTYLFDDTSVDLSGRFLARVHFLVRTGDAKVKARPKILTLDDRQSILHIGEEVPTFQSTGVTRETTGGNFITEINRVTTQYVGFTLNMRPKISGEDEIALQIEVVSNQLRGRERVFEEDLVGVPVVSKRRFTGQPRVKNHRPIILGGLITEEEIESKAMVPILGEIPILGKLFSRTQKEERRTEIILIVTPHILSETGTDRVATPKESLHFDTFDSVLFNDRHIIKGGDVWGIDPITKLPAMVQGEVFTEKEVIDLTLLNVVKRRKLVSKLNIFDEYIPDEATKLGWLQRKYPERSVYYWPDHEKEIYFKAAAIIIENIKELNHPLQYEDIVVPRREIVLPTTPYRMTLSYDKYKTLVQKGSPVVRGNEQVELSEATIKLLRNVARERSVRHFAHFVRRNQIEAADHGALQSELRRLYHQLLPESDAIDTDDYGRFFEELAGAQIDFVTIATYFQENLGARYATRGRPDVGRLETDLTDFLKTTVTISQRAKRLRELEEKWKALSSGSDD